MRTGSIPAGAGEPAGTSRAAGSARVYPRGCGGTAIEECPGIRRRGLSPRVRGNHVSLLAGVEMPGSIPAGAGEPERRGLPSSCTRVYPRGCGGTLNAAMAGPGCEGLSPRVRGNHLHGDGLASAEGSIPAGAGEPVVGPARWTRGRVYPRGCGGTRSRSRAFRLPAGLSPRVRGNLRQKWDQLSSMRSIPAGAGEPAARLRMRNGCWVYPRGCGGTSSRRASSLSMRGLSPRVRGNLPRRHLRPNGRGSIPAGAGEPQ